MFGGNKFKFPTLSINRTGRFAAVDAAPSTAAPDIASTPSHARKKPGNITVEERFGTLPPRARTSPTVSPTTQRADTNAPNMTRAPVRPPAQAPAAGTLTMSSENMAAYHAVSSVSVLLEQIIRQNLPQTDRLPTAQYSGTAPVAAEPVADISGPAIPAVVVETTTAANPLSSAILGDIAGVISGSDSNSGSDSGSDHVSAPGSIRDADSIADSDSEYQKSDYSDFETDSDSDTKSLLRIKTYPSLAAQGDVGDSPAADTVNGSKNSETSFKKLSTAQSSVNVPVAAIEDSVVEIAAADSLSSAILGDIAGVISGSDSNSGSDHVSAPGSIRDADSIADSDSEYQKSDYSNSDTGSDSDTASLLSIKTYPSLAAQGDVGDSPAADTVNGVKSSERSFKKLSVLSNTATKSELPEDYTTLKTEMHNKLQETIFFDAVFQRLDAVSPFKTSTSDLNVFQEYLNDNLDAKHFSGDRADDTGWDNIHRQENGKFSLIDSTGQKLERTREEIELHLSIQGHLGEIDEAAQHAPDCIVLSTDPESASQSKKNATKVPDPVTTPIVNIPVKDPVVNNPIVKNPAVNDPVVKLKQNNSHNGLSKKSDLNDAQKSSSSHGKFKKAWTALSNAFKRKTSNKTKDDTKTATPAEALQSSEPSKSIKAPTNKATGTASNTASSPATSTATKKLTTTNENKPESLTNIQQRKDSDFNDGHILSSSLNEIAQLDQKRNRLVPADLYPDQPKPVNFEFTDLYNNKVWSHAVVPADVPAFKTAISRSHTLQEISIGDNNCWMRAAWLCTFNQWQRQDANVISERLLALKIPNSEADIACIVKMLRTSSKGKSLLNRENAFPEELERSIKRITMHVLESRLIEISSDEESIESAKASVNGKAMGEDNQIFTLMTALGVEAYVWEYDSNGVNIHTLANIAKTIDAKTDDTQKIKSSVLANKLRTMPLLSFATGGAHYDVLLPKMPKLPLQRFVTGS